MDPAYGTASVSRASAFPSTRGRPEAGLYPIFPCADGYVRVVVLAPRQWRAMRAWLGEPAAFQDSARRDPGAARGVRELHELYAALFAGMTKDAIAAEGQARGVPVAPVLDVSEVLAERALRVARRVRRRRGRAGRARPAAERVPRDRRRARRLPPPRARARRAQRRSRAAPGERPARRARRQAPRCRAGRSPGCASSTSGSSSSATRSGACSPTRAPT